jgi:arylsulfatase A-like enzyme
MIASTLYYFRVSANCSDGTSSGFTDSIQKKTLACTTPISLNVTNISAHEATVSWQAQCSSDNYSLKYKANNSAKWLTVQTINQPSEIMTGLVAKTGYQVKVASVCDSMTSVYSNPIPFSTLDSSAAPIHKPNIIVFVLDDARYDHFIPNGAPSWFQTPSINSIAAQGVNFQLCIPAESQCAPSRISIYTGLYPHHHGALNNLTHYNASVPLIQQILKDNGYYTGFVGKYGQEQGNPVGFNYWAISTNDNYINPPYLVNGRDTSINGHITDVYFQFAKTFLTGVPKKQPFMLMYFTRVPHAPAVPRPQDSSLYEKDTMPFPSNFFPYTQNYPSYYYSIDHQWTADSLNTVKYKLKQFQTLFGAECNMDSFITYLSHKGMLDSTIIIVSSDNGFLQGEHLMSEKEVPLEESLKVPLFVRYPTWFKAGKVVTNNTVSNIDIAPTLLEIAGISATYNMDGISLHKLYKGTAVRTNFYYEFGKQSPVPAIRAVRSLNYTYAFDYCNSTTEEFYDRIKDPKEDTNRINTQNYKPLIAYYQNLLDSLKIITGDSLFPKDLTCNLQNPKNSKEANKDISSSVLLHLSPNPVFGGKLEVAFYDPNEKAERISVVDGLGRILWSKNYNEATDYIYEMLDAAAWNPGIYFLKVDEKDNRYTRSFVVQR